MTRSGRLSPCRSALLVLLQVLAAFVLASPVGPVAVDAQVRGVSAGATIKAEAPGLNARFSATVAAHGELPGHTPIDLPPGAAQAALPGHDAPALLAAHRSPATAGHGPVGGRAPPLGNGI
jgi:hypothetical protein